MKIFRLVSGTAAALALVTGLAAAQPAAARDRLSPGAAVALGALGGLAVGAAVGAAVAQPQPPVVYRARRRPRRRFMWRSGRRCITSAPSARSMWSVAPPSATGNGFPDGAGNIAAAGSAASFGKARFLRAFSFDRSGNLDSAVTLTA